MVITQIGKYRLTKDYRCRTSNSIGTLRQGSIIEITQIDPAYHKVIGPELEDWQYWDLPVKPCQQLQCPPVGIVGRRKESAMSKKRKRPNYFQNRYNQWCLAGKIAVKTKAWSPYGPDGKIANIYNDGQGNIDYALVGQDYLRMLNIKVQELE